MEHTRVYVSDNIVLSHGLPMPAPQTCRDVMAVWSEHSLNQLFWTSIFGENQELGNRESSNLKVNGTVSILNSRLASCTYEKSRGCFLFCPVWACPRLRHSIHFWTTPLELMVLVVLPFLMAYHSSRYLLVLMKQGYPKHIWLPIRTASQAVLVWLTFVSLVTLLLSQYIGRFLCISMPLPCHEGCWRLLVVNDLPFFKPPFRMACGKV